MADPAAETYAIYDRILRICWMRTTMDPQPASGL